MITDSMSLSIKKAIHQMSGFFSMSLIHETNTVMIIVLMFDQILLW